MGCRLRRFVHCPTTSTIITKTRNATAKECCRSSQMQTNLFQNAEYPQRQEKATDNLGYPALANAINAYISNRQIRLG